MDPYVQFDPPIPAATCDDNSYVWPETPQGVQFDQANS